MKKTRHLYLFLSPAMGLPAVEYFFENGLFKKLNVHLVFSNTAYFSKRKFYNPVLISDFIKFRKTKHKISQQYKKYSSNIIFTNNFNDSQIAKNIPANSLGLSIGFNQIFNQNTINKFSAFVNLHPSLLPYYKGPTPLKWCLKNKEVTTGWTIHEIDIKIDSGKILYQSPIEIKNKSVVMLQNEIVEAAKVILLQYLESKINNTHFKPKRLEAKQYYKMEVGYRSFL